MDRLDFLRQEIAEAATRIPPLPDMQVLAHLKEIRLLEIEFGLRQEPCDE